MTTKQFQRVKELFDRVVSPLEFDDTDVPEAGEVYFYLVTAEDASGAERSNFTPCM